MVWTTSIVSLWCGLSVSVLMLLLAVPFSVSSVSVFASCFSVWLCYACVFYSCPTNCVPLSCSVWDVSWAECSSSTESLKKPSYSPFSCEGQTNACFALLCLIPFPGKDSIKNLPFCYFLWKILDCFNKSPLFKRLLSHFCCVYPSSSLNHSSLSGVAAHFNGFANLFEEPHFGS